MRVDTDTLGERIAEHVAHMDAAMHLLLTDLREFDQAGGWYRQGFQTCAHWLSWRVGWTLGTAREHVRVANKLVELPQIDEALRTGEMSYCKVRAMTRVATPANEATLLGEAQHTTGHQLETICRKYALVQRHDKESNAKDDSERRYLTRRDQPDGMVQIVAALHPDEAATVWAALERIVKDGYRGCSGASEATETHQVNDGHEANECDVPAGTRSIGASCDEVGARGQSNDVRCDVPAGTRSRCDVPAGTSGSDSTRPTARRAGQESARRQRFSRADALVTIAEEVIRGSRPNRSPIELVVTVAAADLRARTSAASDGRGETDPIAAACYADGTAVSLAVARRLACDAGLVGMVDRDDGAPLSVGRKTRAIPGAMKRALLKRDRCCRFPGCTNRIFLEGHHLRHWVDGGETKLANLVTLCGHHHRFVHEYGYTIELSGTEVRFVDPDGNAVRAVPEPKRPARLGWETIRARNTELAIDADTPACGWDGGRIDLVACIDDLVRAEDRAARRMEM